MRRRNVAASIMAGEGPLFVPFVSENAAAPTALNALSRCISGERLRQIVVNDQVSWSFCRSSFDRRKGYVFAVDGDGTLVYLRRLTVEDNE